MNKQRFTYHLYDTCEPGELREILEGKGIVLSEEAWEVLGDQRPFYEVGLDCEVDEKGEVEILGLEVSPTPSE